MPRPLAPQIIDIYHVSNGGIGQVKRGETVILDLSRPQALAEKIGFGYPYLLAMLVLCLQNCRLSKKLGAGVLKKDVVYS